MKPRILVTGATGFLGRRALAYLRKHDVEIIAVSRQAGEIDGIPLQTLDFTSLSLQDMRRQLAVFACTHLLHLAWYVGPGFYSSLDNLEWTSYSLLLTRAFIDAGGKALIAAGTCAEYRSDTPLPWAEDAPLAGATLYATAKIATSTLMARACAAAGVRCAWGRIAYAYGPGEPSSKFISSIAKTYMDRGEPDIREPEKIVDYIAVDDVARAFVYLTLSGNANGAYNIGSGTPVTLRELVAVIRRALKTSAPCRFGDQQSGGVVLDIQKITALGWTPAIPLEKGVAQTVSELSRMAI